MNDTKIEDIEYKGCIIEKHYDFNPENPLEDWDANGIFYHWKDNGQEEMLKYCELLGYDPDSREQTGEEHPDAVRIDKYEHSGVSYSVHGEGYYCRWDTSSTWAVWFPDDCLMDELKGLKGKKRRDKCIVYARQACKLFNQWANGDVYGFIVKDQSGNEIDSCWGYFGDEAWEDALSECKHFIDEHIKEVGALAPQLLA